MSIPPRLAGKLNDVFGAEAAGDLVSWMDEMRADHAEMRHEMAVLSTRVDALSARVDGLSTRVDRLSAKVDAMSDKFDSKFDALSARFDAKFDALIARFDKSLEHSNALEQRVEYLRGHFIAWNAAFWLTAVAAIVGLLQLLRR